MPERIRDSSRSAERSDPGSRGFEDAMGTGIARHRFGSLALAAAASALALAAPGAADDPKEGQRRGPKVVQLQFSSGRGVGEKSLQAYAYRTEVLRFRASYEGERATADSRYRENVTDTDIDARGEARHPWELLKRGGGRQVLQMTRQSLRERGSAIVRVLAHGNGKLDDVRVRIELSECSQDPPLYPISCEVEV
jgi:hypothetical protein